MLSSLNESKCKTSLKLAIERMRLLQKKKSENVTKCRNEISSYIRSGKVDRARIKVEHLIREDYTIEAIELIELFCDLLLARFPLFARSKQIDPGVEEAVSSIIWAGPRLESEVPELRGVIAGIQRKLGKTFVEECTCNKLQTVNEKLIHRLSIEAPNRLLIEQYLIEIAASHGLTYQADPLVMHQDPRWNLGQQYLANHNAHSMVREVNVSDPPSVFDHQNCPQQTPPPLWPTIYPSAPSLNDSHQAVQKGAQIDLHKVDLTGQNGGSVDDPPADGKRADSDYAKASDWFATSDTGLPLPVISQLSIDLPEVPRNELSHSQSHGEPKDSVTPAADVDDLNRRFNELCNRK